MKRTSLTLGLLVLLTFCLALPGYAASSLYWTTASCATIGGAGTWDTTSTQWSPNSTGGACSAWVNANSDYAYFSGTASYAVANAGNKTLNKIYHTIASEVIVSSSGVLAFAGASSGIDVVSGGYFSKACPFSGTLTKTGAGRVDANNSGDSGKWVISGGYVSFAAVNRCGTYTGSDLITFNGGGFGIGWASTGTSTTLSSAQGITINSGGAFISASASTDDLIIQSPILDGSGGTGTVGLNLTTGSPMVSPYAAGCVVILQNTTTTANAWAGPTTVSSSCTLQLGAANQIPDGSVVTMATGATFNLAGYNETIKSLSSTGGGAVQLGAGTLTLANPAGENAGSAVISGTGGKMVMTTGTWTTSSGSCTYDSGFTLNGGTLYIAGATALGTGTFTINGGTKIASSSTAQRIITNPVNLGADLAWGDAVNTGVLTFNSGAWTLKGGTRTMTLNSAVTISAAIGDGGSGYGLTLAAGTLTLSGANTYSGITTIQNGSLIIGSDGNLGTPPASSVANQLTLNNYINNGANNYGLRDTGGNFTLNVNRGVYLGANGGSINVQNGYTLCVAGVISGPGAFWASPNSSAGYGTIVVSNANNNYTGSTYIGAGTLQLGVNGALPSGTPLTIGSSSLSTSGGSFFDMNGKSQTIGPLASSTGFGATGLGTPTVKLTGALTINETTSTAFAGLISGSGGSLTLTGGGSLTLSVANTYSGATTISAGTLALTGSGTVGTGTITVAGGATFDVSALSSTLTLGASQALYGPSASGTATINAGTSGLTLGTSSPLWLSYFVPGTASFNVTGGALTLASGNTVHVVIKNGGTPLPINDYLLISAGTGGSVAGTAPATVVVNDAGSDGIAAGLTASLLISSSQLYLHVSCTPPGVGPVSPSSQTVCLGSSATFTVPAPTGTGPFHYQWQKVGGGNVGTDSSSYTIASAATGNAGSYQCVVSGACTPDATATAGALVVNTAPAISAQPANQTVCSGSTATFSVTASGAGTLNYSWAKNNNSGWGANPWSVSSGALIGDSSANDGLVTPCTSFTSANDINSPSGNALGLSGGSGATATRLLPALTAGQVVSLDFDNGTVDSGSSVGFSLQDGSANNLLQFFAAVPGATYQYSDNVGGQQDTGIPLQVTGVRVQFVLNSGAYTLIVTPCGGAAATFTGTYTGTIAQLQVFNGNTGTDPTENIYFNNLLVGGYTDNADNYSGSYATYDQGNQPIVSGNGNATYTTPALTVADSGSQFEVVVSGCGGTVLSSAATVTVNPTPTVTVNSPTVCASALPATITATPAGGTGPYTYVWTVPSGPNPGNVASFTTSIAGTYSVVATDANGCASASGSGTLTVNPNPTVTVNSQAICASALPATVTATPSGGTGPYSYVWTVPSGPDPGNVASFTTSVAGAYSVVVTDSSSTLCTSSGSGTLTINANPTVAVNSQTVCSSALPATVTATPAGGTGPYTYVWTVPSGPNPGNVASFTTSVAGTYSVVATDANGCTGSGSGTLTVNASPTVSVNSAAVCSGNSATITASPSGGTSPYNYVWTVPSGPNPGNVASFSASVAGTYSVVVTDANGCAGAGSGVLTVDSAVTADAGSSQTVCAGAPGAELGGSPTATGGTSPYTYSWSPVTGLDDPTSANPTAEVGSTTTYTVTVTDNSGCTGSASVTLTVPPLPNMQEPVMTGLGMVVTWASLNNQVYRVQYTTSLPNPPTPATWTDLTGPSSVPHIDDVTATGPTATFTDTAALTDPQRHYRIFIVCP